MAAPLGAVAWGPRHVTFVMGFVSLHPMFARRPPDRPDVGGTGAGRGLLAAIALAGAAIGVILLADAAGVFVPRFTRDPSTLDGRFGTGAVSLLGSLAWAVSATSLAFAAAVRRAEDRATTPTFRLLAGSAAFTVLLCLDDTFAVHENAERLGDAAELAVGLLYVAVAICWLAWSRPLADRQHRAALVVGGGLLAASLAVDTLSDGGLATFFGAGSIVLEDALKVGGIAAYTTWAVSVSWSARRAGKLGGTLDGEVDLDLPGDELLAR
jgi:hypothetical protein